MRIGFFYRTHPLLNLNRLEYTLRFIEAHPLNTINLEFLVDKRQAFNLGYGLPLEKDMDIFVPQQELFFSNRTTEPVCNKYDFDGVTLYSAEENPKNNLPFIHKHTLGFDLFETIFFNVSRIEEYNVIDDHQDERGQRKDTTLYLVKNNIQKTPIVDHLVFAFLKSIYPKIKPTKSTFSISHDIDFIEKFKSPLSYLNFLQRRILKGNGVTKLTQQYYRTIFDKSKDPYNTFDFLLLENDYIEKYIYFLMGGEHKFDNAFSLGHDFYENAIKIARERNYKIGIHPSYLSWKNSALIIKEKEKLQDNIGMEIVRSRQHYLHFDIGKTPMVLEEAGINEDASLGYTRFIGFRCGTGFSYRLYDFKRECPSSIKEYPLVFMDSSIANEALETNISLEEITSSFLEVNSYHTHINFNFHNSRFDDAAFRGLDLENLYQLIRAHISL